MRERVTNEDGCEPSTMRASKRHKMRKSIAGGGGGGMVLKIGIKKFIK